MAIGLKTITYLVDDLTQAKAMYGELFGAEPYVDTPYYVAYTVDGHDVGLAPGGRQPGITGPIPYWHVDDIHTSLQALVDAGAQTLQDVKEVGGGGSIAIVKDVSGNVIGLYHQA